MLYVSWSKESRPDLGAMLGKSGTDKLATVKEGDGPKRTVQLSRALFVLLSPAERQDECWKRESSERDARTAGA